MKDYRYILFDLDGTLTDPGEGIINSLTYALKQLGIIGQPEILRKFIGPPLMDSFQKYFGFSKPQAQEAIKIYRSYFHDKGLFENYVYPGIPQLLSDLVAAGKTLAVATTKPTVYAVQILEHFNLDSFFQREHIVGSFLDGRRTDKAQLISTVLAELNGDKESMVMVGDRKFDLIGAKSNSIDAIGVTYGYGERSELEAAQPKQIVNSVGELAKLFGLSQ